MVKWNPLEISIPSLLSIMGREEDGYAELYTIRISV
jgi:hypothetical protein